MGRTPPLLFDPNAPIFTSDKRHYAYKNYYSCVAKMRNRGLKKADAEYKCYLLAISQRR